MILDSTYPPDPRVENEATSLIRFGHSVYLFCFDFSQKLPAYELIHGIHVHRIKVSTIIDSISAWAYTFPFYHWYLNQKIKKFLLDTQPDVIHIHDMQVARSVFTINKTLKKPIILDLHENRPEIMKFYSHVRSVKGRLSIFPRLWRKWEAKFIRECSKLVVVTEEAKSYYLQYIDKRPEDIYVVPNTVREEFYKEAVFKNEIESRYKDSFALIYVGDTGIRRGLKTAILSLVELSKLIPNIKLVIVGKSSADGELKEYAQSLDVDSYVDFEGWQDVSLFPSYIRASKIGICPIHYNIHHNTTFANKIFMYLALGKPLVVSDCKPQADIALQYQCGFVHHDQDEVDFTKQILKLYNDPILYLEYSKNAQTAIEQNLKWEIMSKRLQEMYTTI